MAGETIQSAAAKPAAAAKRGIIRWVMFIGYLIVSRRHARPCSSPTIRQLEAHADHGVAPTAAASATTATGDARPRQRLLPRGTRFGLARLLLLPARLLRFTIARCLLLVTGLVVVIVGLARGRRGCGRGLLVGDADFALQ